MTDLKRQKVATPTHVDHLATVFEWCRANPESTLDDAKRYFYPNAIESFSNYKWVELRYQPYYSSLWTQSVLLSDEEYELIEYAEIHLGEINGKHTEVSKRWSELEHQVITDPYEIASKVQKYGQCLPESSVCGSILDNLVFVRDKFMSKKYMTKLLHRFFPTQPESSRKKPNTNLKDNVYGEFEDAKFQELIETACTEMDEKGLYDATQQKWQKQFVEFVDTTFGGTSSVLSIEQPWWEL